MSVNVKTELDAVPPPSSVHLLPCNIHSDSQTSASLYFKPEADSESGRTAWLRGRKLQGKAVPIPSDSIGQFLPPPPSPQLPTPQ
jgi:ribonuclease H2 subunit C